MKMLNRSIRRFIASTSCSRRISTQMESRPSAPAALWDQALQAGSFLRGSILATMAKRMPEREAKELATAWGHKVDQDKINAAVSSALAASKAESESAVDAVVPEVNYSYDFDISAPVEEKHLLHPLYGELISDVGYKKIYATSITRLSQTQVWEKQRILRLERAKAIADSKKKAAGHTGSIAMPGVITIYQDKFSGRCGIIDGQHRAAALVFLADDGHWPTHERNILIDVFETECEDDVVRLFEEINSAEPIRLVDRPGMQLDAASAKKKVAIDEAVAHFEETHPDMFRLLDRARPPFLNADKLRDQLFRTDFCGKNNLRTTKQTIKFLEKINRVLGRYKEQDWVALVGSGKVMVPEAEEGGVKAEVARQHTLSKNFHVALSRAKKRGFYLGLTSKWLTV